MAKALKGTVVVQGFKGRLRLCWSYRRYYSHYADYVEFLLGTGCRVGEVIGLRWGHCSPDCSKVWIGETISRGVRKETKTGRDRYLSLTPRLQQLLLNRKPDVVDPDGLIFPTPNGHAIDDHNFRNRAWKAQSANNKDFALVQAPSLL